MMSLLNKIFLGIAVIFVCVSSAASENDTEKLVYWYRNFDHQATYDVLSLALEKTKDIYGNTSILRSDEVTQGRAVADLQHSANQSVRLISIVADDTRKSDIVPIRIAVDEGLIGLRICIVNRSDLSLFANLRSHQDIADQGITFGQGSHWPDTKILQANALDVVASAQYENLFPMLKSKRFNCFLRGVSEVVSDLKRYGDSSLVIEPNILFSYPSSTLFFVNKKDVDLAARIELGLRRAILDGSFSQYFKSTFSEDLELLKLDERRVIRLNNPLLDTETIKKTSEMLQLSDGKLDVY